MKNNCEDNTYKPILDGSKMFNFDRKIEEGEEKPFGLYL